MSAAPSPADLRRLATRLAGELHFDRAMRTLYATDASVYRELPLAVALPATEADLRELIAFARAHRTSLIPRTAGTSLAGQVVGAGIVVDVSRHFGRILEINSAERWVRVQPGVVRNELNLALKPHGLFFAPETSTQNRAMLGGMAGNNSCGANSIVYGSTRDHLLEARAFLSDGSEAVFGVLTADAFAAKCEARTLEASIYRCARRLLGDATVRAEIDREFPRRSIHRRNTGYALDLLSWSAPFTPGGPAFNFCRLLAGSEGTLAFVTELKLNVVPLPPRESALVCVHCRDIDESLRVNLVALQHAPHSSELIDHYILECTKANLEQSHNRFFVQGDPGAILIAEFCRDTPADLDAVVAAFERDCRAAGLGQHFPVVRGADQSRVWDLRKAALGLLSNLPGDAKPVNCIEDTAVDPQDLPAFIREFNALLQTHGMTCVHYAHAGSGELHLKPILDLKSSEGRRLFRVITEEVAALVKRYGGSLSGEHGDGRLRGEFIARMIGEKNFQLCREIKKAWDPAGIFNLGKITDTPPMDTSLRYEPGQHTRAIDTVLDFSATNGFLHAAEMCSGSGDCRKSHLMGGTMCPSYMATKLEKDTTRARANILREVLTRSDQTDPFASDEIAAVMDLCLSCKGCKSECPSNVDVARLKTEWQQKFHDARGVPLRTRLIANFATAMKWAARAPRLHNAVVTHYITSRLLKRLVGFAGQRSLPTLHPTTLAAWHAKHANRSGLGGVPCNAGPCLPARALATAGGRAAAPPSPDGSVTVGAALRRDTNAESTTNRGVKPLLQSTQDTHPFPHGRVHLFCDEFTNYHDTAVGIQAVELLNRLGYEVVIPAHVASGRAQFSKGLLRDARALAIRNVELLKDVITAGAPLVGLEPSALLGFRDEFPDLMPAHLKDAARALARNALLLDEFIAREADAGRITPSQFTTRPAAIKLHGHCHQKALASIQPTLRALQLPANYRVAVIASGCCGMAGSFGYEAEHYAVSQQIGELVLFPAVRSAPAETLIAAPGTSCRHQIKDGTGRRALHPVEILHAALA
ncbi:MAG: FAD-binding protein [Opitutae bacterium]|nr:FAD-binding protein [Opitutae bacterium]